MSLFFFNDTATTEIYTLSLHDALPISNLLAGQLTGAAPARNGFIGGDRNARPTYVFPNQRVVAHWLATRSEEHTSELQSHSDLVCRLLLEKKNKKLARLDEAACRHPTT